MKLKPKALESATEVVRLMRADDRDRIVPAKEFAALIIQKYMHAERQRKRAAAGAVQPVNGQQAVEK